MSVNPDLFIHESDRTALNALKAIPGFTPLLKGFMKIWNEKQFKLMNMSTLVRISENQMPEYYEMLKPICKRLGIKVPELFMTTDPYPNAYTSGENEPFIVMTTGLVASLPHELIPSVLAHECGHIACHHVLYSTMGRLILGGSAGILGLSPVITAPLQMAFYYWMRCSEFSADRAAAVCGGSSKSVVEVCMRLAGCEKDSPVQANPEAFLEQAKEYRDLVSGSAFNKTLEFMMFSTRSHPLNAVRAYECNEWCKTKEFQSIVQYLDEEEKGSSAHGSVPINENINTYIKKDAVETANALKASGFTNVTIVRSTEQKAGMPVNGIISITANGKTDIKKGEWLPADTPWLITAYMPLSADEEKAAHPGEACVPYSSVGYSGRDYRAVIDELRALGFTNISVSEQPDIKVKFLIKEYSIAHISIDHMDRFDKNTWFKLNAPISIRYHVMAQG
ncbi:M48 family metallopeptidase [Ruminococcus albus]|uniref:Zn-dependent protease with chaperone function n=1 Tax=Ruminococcus albus TaxID=1264 RepID=A0A1H7KBE2_RUMAL|nr:M48 family metallopeptidase [Ruminococcus albus]SEK83800.1 Zn-dependent protease with chaperone function [Ruminococcus albus]